MILLSRGFRSSNRLETFHQTARRHLNIHFCEDLHCSFLLPRGTFGGRHILKKESGCRFAGYLFRWVWDLVLSRVCVKNAILDPDAEYYCRSLP